MAYYKIKNLNLNFENMLFDVKFSYYRFRSSPIGLISTVVIIFEPNNKNTEDIYSWLSSSRRINIIHFLGA